MKIKSVLTVCFLFVAGFSSSLVGYLFGFSVAEKDNIAHNQPQVGQSATPVKAQAPIPDSAQEITESEKAPENSAQKTYILRESNGKIALFIKNSDDKEELHSSYDVPIIFLPKSDRDMLKKGIEFSSLDEIMKFIEDYIG